MEQLRSTVRWWLVDHPAISSFEWAEGRTPASSIPCLSTSIFFYLTFTFFLRHHLPSIPPSFLRLLSAAHNFIILLLSVTMAAGCALSFTLYYSPRSLVCFTPSSTLPRGPLFFWAYVYYLSKLYEFVDTLLIIFSDSASRRLSFLHVYHHAMVAVMAYLWLAARQSLMPLAIVTNATVHVVMYAYYLCCSIRLRWPARWKRALTELQIAQFVFGFVASGAFLWLHFAGGGCEGFNAWVFNAVFNASLLALFLDFHSAAYKEKKKIADTGI